MTKKQFSFNDFEIIIKESLKEISEIIKNHKGVLYTISNRLSFEKWFQLELLKLLIEKTIDFEVHIFQEYELSSKLGKKGKTIDLAIIKNDDKFIGLELKIIPTSYPIENINQKSKKISDLVKDFIDDLSKTKNEFKHSISLAFIAPFPKDLNNRNYRDFEKQESKMKSVGELEKWDCFISDNFNCYFYMLRTENI
ncbi:hypothetical protein [Flavobacterium sp. XS1P27]|uniref:hypothetical protein n=1 Tax=Flavobacterium sp. XS1P27 TaxID=3401724 RepID=UPI003AADDB70